MPIVIQELIASDTLSQAVDKINFNFDQLLLNGGGPVGPAGIPGPTGPVGGRGIRGATWYDGSVDPNTLIIAGVEEDDYFLQSNGQVWQYNGTVWVLTPVNLTGPTGAAGSAAGFDYVGGYNGVNPPTSINNENVAFVVPMPSGISGGANQLTNQGVSTILLGGVGSTATPPVGITYSSAFQIPDAMAVKLDSSLVSVLVHQKDSSSSAIRFMGGGDDLSDNYEQSTLGNLSNITLGVDDAFNINVPKAPTSPVSLSEIIGFNLNTIRRGQQFYSGKQINFISGADVSPSGFGGEISDVTFTINTSNVSNPAKFSVSTTLPSANAVFEAGGNISLLDSTTKVGFIQLDAGDINLIAASRVRLRTSVSHGLDVSPSGTMLMGRSGPILIETFSGQGIDINSNDSIDITSNDEINIGAPTLVSTVAPIIINQGNQISLYGNGLSTHRLRVDNTSVTTGGTKLMGNVTWGVSTLNNPLNTSFRSISIIKDGLTGAVSPIYVHEFGADLGNDIMIDLSRSTGGGPSSSFEYHRLSPTATEIYNTSGRAGYVGHVVQNYDTGVAAGNVGFKLIGRDRASSASVPTTRFHVMEDTTSVYNRMQYVRRYLNINPLTAGITSGTNYTIPATSMNCSFLDIFVGWSGGAFITPNSSHNEFRIIIPDGVYQGQRLNLHLMIAGCQNYSVSPTVRWPAGGAATVTLTANNWAGSSYDITNVQCTDPITPIAPGVYSGGEAYVELMWVGNTYTTAINLGIGNTTHTATRGWMVVNGVNRTGTITSGSVENRTLRAFS